MTVEQFHAASGGLVEVVDDLWAGSVAIAATHAGLTAAPGSTGVGARAQIKFEVARESGEMLIEAIGQQAFDVSFAKVQLGDGFTVSNVTARPDADGAGRCFVTFVVPENQVAKLGPLFARNLIGKAGELVLARSQVTLDELLTSRAE